jgi:SulP family sulfate permease
VVILRLRGYDDLGSTFMDLLGRYAESLTLAESRLVLMSLRPRVMDQLVVTGVADTIGSENLYPRDDWVGREMREAMSQAQEWVDEHRAPTENEDGSSNGADAAPGDAPESQA